MIAQFFCRLWYAVREVCGENDYRRYHSRLIARGETPVTPAEFYLSTLERKYSQPNRCC